MGQEPSSRYKAGEMYPNTTRFDKRDPPPKHFNDGAKAQGKYLKGMVLYFREHRHTPATRGRTPVLAGFKASYCDQNNEVTTTEHGDIKPEGKWYVEKFDVNQAQNDRIVTVFIRCGLFLDQMEFRTRDGRVFGPYGWQPDGSKETGGSPHRESISDHGPDFQHLSYISGAVVETEGGTSIIKLQLHWE